MVLKVGLLGKVVYSVQRENDEDGEKNVALLFFYFPSSSFSRGTKHAI